MPHLQKFEKVENWRQSQCKFSQRHLKSEKLLDIRRFENFSFSVVIVILEERWRRNDVGRKRWIFELHREDEHHRPYSQPIIFRIFKRKFRLLSYFSVLVVIFSLDCIEDAIIQKCVQYSRFSKLFIKKKNTSTLPVLYITLLIIIFLFCKNFLCSFCLI